MSVRKPWIKIRRDCKRANLTPLFSALEYTNSRDRLPYMCNGCGEVEFKMGINVAKGRGCVRCGQIRGFTKQRKPMKQLIVEARAVFAKPLFAFSEYGGLYKRVPYACLRCGHSWSVFPKNICHGQGCPKCGRKKAAASKRHEFSELLKHADLLGLVPKYRQKDYLRGTQSLPYKCLSCGLVSQKRPADVLAGKGCRNCSKHVGEKICRFFMRELFGEEFPMSRPEWLCNSRGNRMDLDGFSDSLKIAFEHQGEQHYTTESRFIRSKSVLKTRIADDKRKRILCKRNGVVLFTIPEIGSRLPLSDLQNFLLTEAQRLGVEVPKARMSRQIRLDKKALYGAQLEKYKQTAAELGLRVVSDVWLGTKRKIKHECLKCGHVHMKSPGGVLSGKGCAKCAGVLRHSNQWVRNELEKLGASWISGSYKNVSSVLLVKCASGHPYRKPFNHIRHEWKGRGCPLCWRQVWLAQRTRMVEETLARKNFMLVGPYLNANTPLEIQCVSCRRTHRSKIHTILNWKNGCIYCGKKRLPE